MRQPEVAAARGWSDLDSCATSGDKNAKLKGFQFADYHGHGWNFRGSAGRIDRAGNLPDADGNMATYGTDKAHIAAPDDPEKWQAPAPSSSW